MDETRTSCSGWYTTANPHPDRDRHLENNEYRAFLDKREALPKMAGPLKLAAALRVGGCLASPIISV